MRRRGLRRLWLPLGVGLIVFAMAAGTARFLRARENAALERASLAALHRAESAIRHRIADHVWGLSQLGSSWEQSGGLSEPEWRRRARALLAQFVHIQAVEYADPSLRVRRVVPLAGNEAALGHD